MNDVDDKHLEEYRHLLAPANAQTGNPSTSVDSTTDPRLDLNNLQQSTGRSTRAKHRKLGGSSSSHLSPFPAAAPSGSSTVPPPPRRSARISSSSCQEGAQAPTSPNIKGRSEPDIIDSGAAQLQHHTASSPAVEPASVLVPDRKGKKRALPPKSLNQAEHKHPTAQDDHPRVKRSRQSKDSPSGSYKLRSRLRAEVLASSSAVKGKTKAGSPVEGQTSVNKMPKKANPKQKKIGPASGGDDRMKKGDIAGKLSDENPMNDDSLWVDEPGGSRSGHQLLADGEGHEDEDMSGSGHGDDEEEEDDSQDLNEDTGFRPSGDIGALDGAASAYGRLARLAGGGMGLDEATAAALFGGEFRAFGGMMSGLSSRFKRLKTELRSPNSTVRLSALRECSELLLVSNEDTLGGTFSTNSFATEFIALLKGQPNIDEDGPTESASKPAEEMDEDAQLVVALALSTGGSMTSGVPNEDEMECQLVACRCLAHLMEALPGTGHTLVHLGAVPVLCSKLNEISYIELAEQTLSTMEKISAEYPAAIVREGGLGALLNYLPFFSTNVQRTAVTAAANCCRNVSAEHYKQIHEVFPILRDTLTQADQRLVEQATLAVVRILEAYRHNAEHLEGLLDLPSVVAINALLMPSGGSPLLSPTAYTHLLKALTSSARGSARVTIAFLEAGMTNTVYQILTGVLPSVHSDDEQGASENGQGLAGGVADMVILQNLAHRPKDQVEESLALICELLPPSPRDGVFDARSYTEKSLLKIKKGHKSDRPSTRSSKAFEVDISASAGPSTPDNPSAALPVSTEALTTASSTVKEALKKAKKEADAQLQQRVELLKAHPQLVGKFIAAILPVLVDVYAASVASRVRAKVLSALVKAIAFASSEDLRTALKAVPMASFLGAIMSSRENPTFVMNALQLVELLAIKLPDVYLTSFLREGVVFEIEALAEQDLTTAKSASEDSTTVKTEPDDGSRPAPAGPSAPISKTQSLVIPDELKPIFASAGLPSGLVAYLADHPGGSPSRRAASSVDTLDANILRARMLGAKKLFDVAGDHKHAASVVLAELGSSVKRLCRPEATEAELRESLRDISGRFSNLGHPLSSFELSKSGLVDGLLEFLAIDGAISLSERRIMLFEIFADTSICFPSPLALLVKRLHESLGRLEAFEVEAAFGGAVDSSRPASSGLSRTMRIRLQAEEGQDIPKHISTLSVTIQAIAPIQALHDYIRSRLADGGAMSGSGLSSMFAAYAAGMPIPRGTTGTSASRLLSALSASGSGGLIGEPSSAPIASSAPESTSRLNMPPLSTAAQQTNKPQDPPRRRSARLSGHGAGELVPTPIDQPSNSTTLSSSAPEPSILPSMPMDMEFDDDEGYSDEEYDAEVYEEDMEEELARPMEKVVNMSVASDGTRVEAKTPEGTRIGTPNQSATAGAAGPSGGVTPRTASYAGAVKTTPSDWHLEFTLNGKEVSLGDTIYGAVHKCQDGTAASGSNMGGVHGMPVLFKFKRVDGPQRSAKDTMPFDALSPGSVATTMPVGLDSEAPTSKILRLLRVLHKLSNDARNLTPHNNSHIEENLFVNNKLTAKLARQLEETMIIASNCLPEWSIELPKHFAFLFPFEVRYSFLQATSFGYGRLIARYQSSQQNNRSSNRRDELAHLARIVRQKVRISRAQLLESAAKVLELYGTSNGILEIEYFDEIGTGLGPTLEFYSLVSQAFARRSLKIWRDEDESKAGEHVFHPGGLFPAPLDPSDDTSVSRLTWFKTLGLFIGRALLDSRIIDVDLNKVLLSSILGRPVRKTIATLKLVDPTLARSMERLQVYLQARKEIESLQLPASARRNKLAALTVGGAKLGDLALDFTLPGYNIELKPGGAHIEVDETNLEEYLERVLALTLGSGVSQQVKAFQEGFSMIFPIQDMQIFSSEELGLLFGNADEDWSKDTLAQAIKADHGYNLDSRAVQNLVETMTSYTSEQRRQFLQFVTGAPKLPIGGFRGLNPPFTVVRKPHEPPFRADDYLPSVMTCAQYLKLPDYSSKAILGAQLERAMIDGGGSFHLS